MSYHAARAAHSPAALAAGIDFKTTEKGTSVAFNSYQAPMFGRKIAAEKENLGDGFGHNGLGAGRLRA